MDQHDLEQPIEKCPDRFAGSDPDAEPNDTFGAKKLLCHAVFC